MLSPASSLRECPRGLLCSGEAGKYNGQRAFYNIASIVNLKALTVVGFFIFLPLDISAHPEFSLYLLVFIIKDMIHPLKAL